MTETLWYKISGGRWVLQGWKLGAFFTDSEPSKWLTYGTCPLCGAMVLADQLRADRDFTQSHEQWHAATDYPLPNSTDHATPNRRERS